MDGETHVLTDLYNALEQDSSSVIVHERLLVIWQELGEEGNEALLYSILPPSREQRLTGIDRYGIWDCVSSPIY